MATSYLAPITNGFQFLDASGRVLSGGTINTYLAGTTTPQATYSDRTGLVVNTNPLVLDASGRLANEVWLTTGIAYKFVLKDSTGTTIATYDNLPGINDPLGFGSGATAPTVTYTHTGSIFARTVQAKLDEWITPEDFGCIGDGSVNDTLNFTAALNYAAANGGMLRLMPGKNYSVSSIPITSGSVIIEGYGATVTQRALGNLNPSPLFQGQGCTSLIFKGGTLDGNKAAQPANGFSDTYNGGANGQGRQFRSAIDNDNVVNANAMTKLFVKDVKFRNFYGACVSARDTGNVTVETCEASANNFELAALWYSATPPRNIRIVNNTADTCASGDATINSNSIFVQNGRDVVITGNILYNQERCGVNVTGGMNVNVADNVIDTNTKDGFAGIYIDSTALAQYRVKCDDNNIYNCGRGIVQAGYGIDRLSVEDNTVDNTTATAVADGISFDNLPFGHISGNQLSNIKRHGLIGKCSGGRIKISNNSFHGQATAGSYGMQLNTDIAAAISVTVIGNDWENFEKSAAGLGMVNFINAGGFLFTQFMFAKNAILAGAVGNRAFRQPVANLFSNGAIIGNIIDGQFEMVASNVRVQNTVSGTVTLPANIVNTDITQTSQTTVGAAGGATAQPATPLGYLLVNINGTERAVPYHIKA